jgi:hypothetical protein
MKSRKRAGKAIPKTRRRRPRQEPRRRVRKNPAGKVTLIWIWPDGGVAEIPADKNHRTAVPEEMRTAPGRCRPGFFRGATINQRLYIEKNGIREPSPAQMRSLRTYARAEGLSRGIVIERIPGV